MTETYEESIKKRGRWTTEEQKLFKISFHYYGKDWKKLSEIIQSRSIVQIRSHAQKYCDKFTTKCNSETPTQKLYILNSETLDSLKDYISTTSSESYKKYMEIQQTLMYTQSSPIHYETKLAEVVLKSDLGHT